MVQPRYFNILYYKVAPTRVENGRKIAKTPRNLWTNSNKSRERVLAGSKNFDPFLPLAKPLGQHEAKVMRGRGDDDDEDRRKVKW